METNQATIVDYFSACDQNVVVHFQMSKSSGSRVENKGKTRATV